MPTYKNPSSQSAYLPHPNHHTSPKVRNNPTRHPPAPFLDFLPHLLLMRDEIGCLGHCITPRYRFRRRYRGDSGYTSSCHAALADSISSLVSSTEGDHPNHLPIHLAIHRPFQVFLSGDAISPHPSGHSSTFPGFSFRGRHISPSIWPFIGHSRLFLQRTPLVHQPPGFLQY